MSEEVSTPVNDIKSLTIKNLDTGEEFIIGENDPDFEFDTFEIGANANDEIQQDGDEGHAEVVHRKSKSWWKYFASFVYGSSVYDQSNPNYDKDRYEKSSEINYTITPKTKTPFTKLSSFKFKKELGKGAFGRVLLAEAKTDGKLYALKIISKANMRSSDKRQAKAERDILHAMALKAPHPFTSGLKFAFQSENNLYLGMDFIPGGNLRELIKKFKHLPEEWVTFYAAELILAISHLHSLNVLYRDIKPHNVMIDARGHVILIDFGLSKQEISHPRGAMSLVGTPDYSAPEVLKTGVQQIEAHNREKKKRKESGNKGDKKDKKDKDKDNNNSSKSSKMGYGKAADWWSLGIMIYEMLGGTPTFRGTDLRHTYQRILYADLEFAPEERFSTDAKILLTGLIKRDPAARLGAWENPPTDIMTSSFFKSIDWNNILDRQRDGPYIPETSPFYALSGSGRRNSAERKSKAEDDEFKRFSANNTDSTPYTNRTKPNTATQATIDEDEDEESDEDELMNLRDSIFVSAKNDNKLLDWSFIDAEVLMSSTKQPHINNNNNNDNNNNNNKEATIVNEEKEELQQQLAEENNEDLKEPVVDNCKNQIDSVDDASNSNNDNNNNDNNDIDNVTVVDNEGEDTVTPYDVNLQENKVEEQSNELSNDNKTTTGPTSN